MKQKLTPNLYPVQARYPTHWSDMDQARHVNNLIYLRWAETLRVVYFEAIGMDISFDAAGDVGPILGWQDCKYTFPMMHPDMALVGARTLEVSEDRFTIETAIFSVAHDRLAAVSKQVIVPYDYGKLRKAALPEGWKKGLERFHT